MIRFTTPVISVTVKKDLTGNEITFSILQDEKVAIDKEITTFEVDQHGVTSFQVFLSQEETGRLRAGGSALLQVNWINAAGIRDATKIKEIPVFRNLLDKVIDYGD